MVTRLSPRTLLALALSLQGCGIFHLLGKVGDITRSGDKGDSFSVPGYRVAPPVARNFAAGAGIADITPPTGYPTGGHGPAGDIARGYWLRLRARAFFFEDASGRTVALVSADLFAVPGGLAQRVAALATERLDREGIAVSLPPQAIILAATHTHHGPGNFLTARIYNQFGSSWPGFDKDLFEFLASRIADAVADAVRSARSNAGPVELTLHSTTVGYDLLRNRSPRTFLMNRNRDALLDALNAGTSRPHCDPLAGEPRGAWGDPHCARLRAVNRKLTVVEVKRAGERIAALVFFAVHPTDLPAETPFYSPDFVGAALAHLERQQVPRGGSFVAGFFNGAEGDVTLRRRHRDLLEVAAFGDAFASAIGEALGGPGTPVAIASGIVVRAREVRPSEQGSCGAARIAPTPVLGAAALGGAEDDRTQLYDLGWKDGVHESSAQGLQGVKLPALDSRLLRGATFTSEFAQEEAFPRTISLAIASVGDLTLAAIPVEASTAEGAAIERELRSGTRPFQIVGLANQYASYCASRDEYWAQDYMGASTLWGSAEGPYLVCKLKELATVEPIRWFGTVDTAEFLPGVDPKPPFGVSFVGTTERPDDGLDEILRDANGLPERSLPWFQWAEAGKEKPFDRTRKRKVEIWKRDAAGGFQRADDDSTGAVLTMHLGADRWAAIWLGPLFARRPGEYAFRVEAEGTKCSDAFPIEARGPGPDLVKPADCEKISGSR